MHWKTHNKVITVFDGIGNPIFYSLDDGFGLDRVRDWALARGIDFALIKKGAHLKVKGE